MGSSKPASPTPGKSLLMGVLIGHPRPPGPRRSVVAVDNRSEVREFLTSRRAKVTPQQVGLPETFHRRVPGLRRSEVAALAGMSVEYYAKLERGSLGGVSAGVLDAIARALQFDEAERAHLFHLAHAADGTSAAMRPRRRSPKQWPVRPSLQWTLDSITTGPAIVGNNRSDLLATNHLGRALYIDVYNDADAARTLPASPSLTPPPTGSTPTGTSPPTSPLPTCEPQRAGPARQGAPRPGRRVVHPQRRVPPPLGSPQRPHPRHRHQTLPPPHRRRPHPRLRKPRPQSRTRPHHDHLRRRTRFTVRRASASARLLGGLARGGIDRARR